MEGSIPEFIPQFDVVAAFPDSNIVFGGSFCGGFQVCSQCGVDLTNMGRWECVQCGKRQCAVCRGSETSVCGIDGHVDVCMWPDALPWARGLHDDDVCHLVEVVPEEIVIQICLKLDLEDVAALMNTCKRMSQMRTWNFLWRGLARVHYLPFLPWVDCRPEPLYFDRLRVMLALKTHPPPSCSASSLYSHGLGPQTSLKVLQHAIHVDHVSASIHSTAVLNGSVYALSHTGIILAGKVSSGEHQWSTRLPKFGVVTADSSAAKATVPKQFRPQIVALPDAGIAATDGISLYLVSFNGQRVLQIFNNSITSMLTRLNVVSSSHVAFVRGRFGERLVRKPDADRKTWLELWRKFPTFAESMRGPRYEILPSYSHMLRASVSRGTMAQLLFVMGLRSSTVEDVQKALKGHPSLLKKFSHRVSMRLAQETTLLSTGFLLTSEEEEEEDDDDDNDDGKEEDHKAGENVRRGGVRVKALKHVGLRDVAGRPPHAAAQEMELALQFVDLQALSRLPASSSIASFEDAQVVALPRTLLCMLAGLAPSASKAWVDVAIHDICSWDAYTAVAVVASEGSKHRKRAVVLLVHPVYGIVGFTDWTERGLEHDLSSIALIHRPSPENDDDSSMIRNLCWVCLQGERHVLRLPFHPLEVSRSGAFVALQAPRNGIVYEHDRGTSTIHASAYNPASGMFFAATRAPFRKAENAGEGGGDEVGVEEAPEPITLVAVDLRATPAVVRWCLPMTLDQTPNAPILNIGSEPFHSLNNCAQIRVSDSSLYLVGERERHMCLARVDLLDREGPRVMSIHGFAGVVTDEDDGDACLVWDTHENPVQDAVLLCGGNLCIVSQRSPARLAANLALLELMRQGDNPLAGLLGLFGPLVGLGVDGGGGDDDDDHQQPQGQRQQRRNNVGLVPPLPPVDEVMARRHIEDALAMAFGNPLANNNNNNNNGDDDDLPRLVGSQDDSDDAVNNGAVDDNGDSSDDDDDDDDDEDDDEIVGDDEDDDIDDDMDEGDDDDDEDDDDGVGDASNAPGPHDLRWCIECNKFHE